MKFGLFLATQWPEGTPLAGALGELAEQVRVAKANGFDSIWAGQHWLVHPMQMLQVTPLLARLMAEAEGMTFGPGILLLSMLNPVLAAEEAATLDWLSGGRYVLAVGLGYRPEEFEATGVEMRRRVSRTVEAIEVIRKLWTGERITHHGRHFRLTDVGISVVPRHPIPIWIGGSSDKAVERAARIADAWLMSFNPTEAMLVRWVGMHRAAREAAGLPPAADYPVCREVFVAPDGANALDQVRGPLVYKYSAYAAWGNAGAAGTDFASQIDAFAAERFIIGDAAKVKDDIQRYRDRLGATHFVMRMQWPGMAQRDVLASIERMGGIIRNLAG